MQYLCQRYRQRKLVVFMQQSCTFRVRATRGDLGLGVACCARPNRSIPAQNRCKANSPPSFPCRKTHKGSSNPMVRFGSFDDICQKAALVICPLVGTDQGIEPTCYSRNVEIGGTLIFQPCPSFSAPSPPSISLLSPATCFVHIAALFMTAIMIYHVRSKYTAVGSFSYALAARLCQPCLPKTGRKEIITFFYLYAVIELLAMFLDSGVIQTASPPYPVRHFFHNARSCPS